MEKLFNWEVLEKEIQTTEGIAIPSKKALYRSDTNELIEVKNDTYETLFNHEIQMVAEAIVKEKGIEGARTHTLRGGKSVIAQLSLPDMFVVENDKVTEFLTLINSHDGMSGFLIGFGNTVMSCQNQFYQFKKAAQIKIAHTKSMMHRIEMALDGIEKLQVQKKLLQDYLLEFGNVKVDGEKFAKEFIEREMKFDVTASPEILKKDFGIGTRTYNNAVALKNDILGEMSRKGETMWGAFNGVTYYTNHTQKAKERETHLVFGSGQNLNQAALSFGMEMIKS